MNGIDNNFDGLENTESLSKYTVASLDEKYKILEDSFSEHGRKFGTVVTFPEYLDNLAKALLRGYILYNEMFSIAAAGEPPLNPLEIIVHTAEISDEVEKKWEQTDENGEANKAIWRRLALTTYTFNKLYVPKDPEQDEAENEDAASKVA